MTEVWQRRLRDAGPLPAVGAMLVAALIAVSLGRTCARQPARVMVTLADLKPVHAGVVVADKALSGLYRVAEGDAVVTDADGRARLRLDDGTTCLVDRGTRLRVLPSGIVLEAGRLFVQGAEGVKSEILLGELAVTLSGSNAGLERHGSASSAYSANAELNVRYAGVSHQVNSGETARLADGKFEVAPERAYDDWTYGLAAPWAARGAPRRAIGELWGVGDDSAMAPLTIRSHAIDARIEGEVARTRAETTYFNGGSNSVQGDFRMAVPPGAIVSRFSVERDGSRVDSQIALASRTEVSRRPNAVMLEWAGEGWLRGSVPSIPAGQTVKMSVEYVAWLSPRKSGANSLVEYRYPLVGEGKAPLIGEFFAHVDAARSAPLSLSSGALSTHTGTSIDLRRSDFRPAADLVVSVEERASSGRARLYYAPATEQDGEAGGTVLLRTELATPEATDGVTLALVLDTSGSAEPAILAAERALVEAVLAGLGARDRVVVLAADQATRPVGPAALGPVDAARRAAISAGLSQLAPGGASDLGRAFEAAVDALPADAPSAMAIYVGDGWPTLGDPSLAAIQARLARRPGGVPRIGAVAVGPLSNRALLAALSRGSGPLFEIADSEDAARTAVELVADALRPALSDVEVDLGPLVDRVYPRTPRAVLAGETFSATGRVRGELPKAVTVRWRDARGRHAEVRAVELIPTEADDDVRRRWAAARVEEIVLSGRGREAATDVALRAGLITPWTALRVGDGPYVPTPFATRILDLSSDGEGVVGPVFATPASLLGTLAAPGADSALASDAALDTALTSAASRAMDEAGPALRACRDSRTALRPERAGALAISVEIAEGQARAARVRGATVAAEDAALDRCVELVLMGLHYPGAGLGVSITLKRLFELPPSSQPLGARRCSDTSRLPMPLRRGVWQERLERSKPAQVYVDAKHQCELPTWTDRRALLELVLGAVQAGTARVDVARELEQSGELDAATLLRREAVRRAQTPAELRAIRLALLGDERYPRAQFEKRYQAATGDAARLSVVRRFLELAPHDGRLRGRMLALLEALAEKPALVEEVRQIRLDPFADAALLADAASALHRAGDEPEARRTFGELAERAPRDPWVRGFLGDRLRAEGWFDEATAAYAVLEELMPGDASVALRSALAHAGAGRIDIAERMLSRVASTGGRAGSADLGALAGHLGRLLAAEELARPNAALAPADSERLARVALEIPHEPDVAIALVRASAVGSGLSVEVVRGPAGAREHKAPDLAAPGLGLYATRLESGSNGDPPLRLVLHRPRAELPARPAHVQIDALMPDGADRPPRVLSTEIDLPADASSVELEWSAGAWHRGRG